ncbi:hypothetical protein [Sinomicrobium weinanense]|uniref:Lipocalin-like domain-containing protein n=1 Tax=Sinomicrobium weinanense TaxID=2842200 RepID=A0A926JVF2_9FLAO|nr:hypothetical protein [Sinomicrobium weinanense]MBC9798298.1 hypothetical protein [Sinomicrobium weinanense]MBU3124541.1 hypothetical protein [Sinomicrobium weinanense]
MKKHRNNIFVFSLFLLFSCSGDNDPEDAELVGSWKLIEYLADPGNGSGSFQPVNSDKTVTFHADKTITSNGKLCTFTIRADAGKRGTGVYSLTDSIITPNDCTEQQHSNIYFEMDNNNLIIKYICVEGCAQKFKKTASTE